MFGVVVVGVGLAGRVRIRDLLQWQDQIEDISPVKLVGYVSRREIPIEGCTQLSLEDVLKSKNVHAVLICTENETHYEFARQVIRAKKHVLVEFPLARSADKAKELLEEAELQNVICYEEDISLLTAPHIALKEILQHKPITEGVVTLEAALLEGKWVGNFERSGSPFHSSVSQIHNIVDLFGDMEAISAQIKVADTHVFSTGVLRTKEGKDIMVNIIRKPDMKRARKFCFTFEDGTTMDQVPGFEDEPVRDLSKPGLFMQDFIKFYQFVKTGYGKNLTYFHWLTTRSLELADKLYELAKSNTSSELNQE